MPCSQGFTLDTPGEHKLRGGGGGGGGMQTYPFGQLECDVGGGGGGRLHFPNSSRNTFNVSYDADAVPCTYLQMCARARARLRAPCARARVAPHRACDDVRRGRYTDVQGAVAKCPVTLTATVSGGGGAGFTAVGAGVLPLLFGGGFNFSAAVTFPGPATAAGAARVSAGVPVDPVRSRARLVGRSVALRVPDCRPRAGRRDRRGRGAVPEHLRPARPAGHVGVRARALARIHTPARAHSHCRARSCLCPCMKSSYMALDLAWAAAMECDN